jgi:hypothetical protein
MLMVLAPFVLGGTAFWYVARYGRKTPPSPNGR